MRVGHLVQLSFAPRCCLFCLAQHSVEPVAQERAVVLRPRELGLCGVAILTRRPAVYLRAVQRFLQMRDVRGRGQQLPLAVVGARPLGVCLGLETVRLPRQLGADLVQPSMN